MSTVDVGTNTDHETGPPVRCNMARAAANEESPYCARRRTGMVIIPLKVTVRGGSKSVITYAFLDKGSNSTFCTESLALQLGLTGQRTKISLSTLEKKNSVVDSFITGLLQQTITWYMVVGKLIIIPALGQQNKGESSFTGSGLFVLMSQCGNNNQLAHHHVPYDRLLQKAYIRDLLVSGLDEDKNICLPTLYTRPEIPVSSNGIPTQDDIDRWPQHQGVFIPNVQAEVALLIAVNVPAALDPLEIKHSREGGPYATRTRIG